MMYGKDSYSYPSTHESPKPCIIPVLSFLHDGDEQSVSIDVDIHHHNELQPLLTGATVSSIFRAAWSLVLNCYTNQEHISFGLHEALLCEGLVKHSVHRIIIDDNSTLASTISKISSGQADGFEKPKQQGVGDPMYNTCLVVVEESGAASAAGNPHSAPALATLSDEQCDVLVGIRTCNDYLRVVLQGRRGRMSRAQLSNIAGTLRTVLSRICAPADQRVSDIELLSGRDREQILHWNSKTLEEVKRCIHEVIQDNALAKPDAEAICFTGGSISYMELDQHSDQLAAHLIDSGMCSGDFVALCFDKSPWNVVAMLAVMKAGGAFMPMDPAAPLGRLQILINKVKAKTILCSERFTGMLGDTGCLVIPVNRLTIANLRESKQSLPIVKDTTLAYLIWTSGTTGEPKGTMIRHRSYCSGVKAHGPAMLITTESRVLQFAAHTFDASLVEVLTTLMVGGVVCIPGEEDRLNDTASIIDHLQVNLAVLTPSFIDFINPDDVPGLKTLVLAGEAMNRSHLERWSHINLVNGYGPSEASVAAVVNSSVTASTSPTNIGFATGVHAWVVDSTNHERLVPIGSIGELVIQGPSIASGYHNDADRTRLVFLDNASWASTEENKRWRLYKTGDLVRQNLDGTLEFVGRKDTQVKVHGQRVELGEIEHHLTAHALVSNGVVLFPKVGFFKDRLISVLSLSDTSTDHGRNGPFRLIDGHAEEREVIHNFLVSHLPIHMVPNVLVVLESLPFLASGKLDRKAIASWTECMDDDTYRQIIELPNSKTTDVGPALVAATETETKLRDIWSHVLNLPPDSIPFNRSFMSLGGDSITAMQVKGRCMKHNIEIGVDEILRSKSITGLAQYAGVLEYKYQHEEVLEQPFELSPIQGMYFMLPDQGRGHFNQSFFLRVTRKTTKTDLERALETIVRRHSMLRARFSMSEGGKSWQQRITSNISASYRLKAHDLVDTKQRDLAIASSQSCLDVVSGPVFAADLFNGTVQDEEEQLLFLVGHHLVIDLVSWRVILEDLEDLLLHPGISSPAVPTPFQTWCQMQLNHSQTMATEKAFPFSGIQSSDFKYWGMSEQSNTYGQVACEGFEVNREATSILLNQCHEALSTEAVDILIASLIYSFGKVFEDRPSPAIFNEGHGREPSGMSVDLSRTVGWFTIMYPIQIGNFHDQIDTVKLVKDFRRKVPDNGRPYFASRCLTKEGGKRFKQHWPLEVTFNYLGQYQQLEREESLLRPVEMMAGETRGAGGTADVGQDTPRFGLFEISAVIAQGKLRFAFTFNHQMKHQDKIRHWISKCHETICETVKLLSDREPEATPSDFPLLSLTYDSLDVMTGEKLPTLGIASIETIEDIYPCSSMQEGILITQAKSASFYAVQVICRLNHQSHGTVKADKLARAWQQVVDRHACLRTVFIQSVSNDDGLYDQVVLKKVAASIHHVECSSERYALKILDKQDPNPHGEQGCPPHRFTVCKTSDGEILCKLEISHAIMDGTSMSIIFRDLAAAYEGKLDPGPGPLYSNYISYLQIQPSEASADYWKTYLNGVKSSVFPVLNDGISPESKLNSSRLDFKKSDFRKLRKFCDGTTLTLSNVLHTAWALTLRCYTASDDVCFGYLSSGRDAPIPGIEDAVGPFINTLVCRVRMTPASRLEAVLDRVQKDHVESLPHRNLSLAEVQHSLPLSGGALFNTALSYRKLPFQQTTENAEVSFSEVVPTYDPTEYPLSINIEASNDNAVIDLDYWTDYISDGQARNIGKVFLQAIENIVHKSNVPVGQLDHFNADHSRQICDVWNSNMPQSVDDCVHLVIEGQARKQPGAPAISSWDCELTYAELDALSNRLSQYLASSMDVGPEMYVPTCFDKSPWAIVAMLAVLKAGGAAVPLDAKHPRAALELRVKDTHATIVLVSPSRVELFQDMKVNALAIDRQLIDNLTDYPLLASAPAQPSNAAFIIYTSGSTGLPKGVVLEHRAIVTSGHATGTAYKFDSQSRVLQFAAYTFDNSLAEIFITLMRGGCVCVPSEHERFNDLAGAINRLNVNFMDITPTVASFLNPSDVPTVKGLSLGGEPLTKELIDIWGNAVSLHCCYGPSECSINSTWNGDLLASSEATNIGRSIGSVSWIVDPSNHDLLMPIGCVGELLIEGPILAREYLNDSEKTSNAFILNPAWVTEGHHRMYKTGDLARYNSNGTITYLGRKDFQVKLNGQRIELGEIEHHAKLNLSADMQSAVELVTLSGSRKALAAFLCTESSKSTLETDSLLLPISDHIRVIASTLKAAITALLPVYMVPTLYIPVTRMPLTSSGKLDRRSLRDACKTLSETEAAKYRLATKSGARPSTKMEKTLADLWETVLNLEPNTVGADDNFFRMSGDSIGAMKLITAARAKGITLTVASIFQKPKLFDLALDAISAVNEKDYRVIETETKPFDLIHKNENFSRQELLEEVASQCLVDPKLIEDIYPCTAIQEGLIALSNKDPGAYVAQSVYQLPASIDFDKFREAWQAVFEAEVILRTRIVFTESSGFLQVVLREPLAWRSAPGIEDVLRNKSQLPSHNGGPLATYTIIPDSAQFVWTAHHAIYDGWSLPTLLQRVEACYSDVSSPDAKTGRGFPRFIRYLTECDNAAVNAFWSTKLLETTAAQFPVLPHPAYQVQATSVSCHTAQVVRNSGSSITLPSTIRAAWALVIAVYSGVSDVVFGETLTGRDAPVQDIENIVGPTLATVPTRIQVNQETTVGKFLEDVQSSSAEAIPYQYAGLQCIKQVSRDAAIACGFQNLLAIHHNTNESTSGFWNLKSSGTVGTNFYSYPLTISCQISNEAVEFEAHFDHDIISTWFVDKILNQFEFILRKLLSLVNFDIKLCDIESLNPTDEALIKSWNRLPLAAVDTCIHKLVEQQVLKQPASKIAVHGWDVSFTYQELDILSTQLARHLVHCGAQRSLIPICFEKSAWTVVAMLTILKSGAAFVPLDPTAPIARLQGIIDDTEAQLLLCSASHAELCRSLSRHVIAVDSDIFAGLSSLDDILPSVDSQDPCYVIFTSGTTGKPKGTILQHAAFCSGAAAHGPTLGITSDSRVLQFASYTFDASLLEILTTLTFGGCVCVPSEDARLNNIAEVIKEMNITWTLLTPSFIQMLQPSAIPDLKTLVLGGEAMSQSHIATWADKLELINAYGPSEAAVVATVNPQVTITTDPSNMGHAVGGRSWIVDIVSGNRLAPVGGVGELVIEGPILAQGYLKNDIKTREMFIEDPQWAQDARDMPRRMYRTGDLVRYTFEGQLIFCGRKDTQTKIHGQRIELSEVEHHLREDCSIRHVLASVPKAGFCKGRLVVALSLKGDLISTSTFGDFKLVAHEGKNFSLSSIRNRLCQYLPAYMIPSSWIVVQSLPLQPSGKLDRRRIEQYLENMDAETFQQVSDIAAIEQESQVTLIEGQLQDIVGEILNLPARQIGLQRSFLHLGGDSISAMQVMSTCRSHGLGVTVKDIIQSKSISHLALLVTLPEEVVHQIEEVNKPFDLSPIQRLFFECVDEKFGHFNQSILVRLVRPTSAERLSAALDTIVRTHSMLRARFDKNDAGTWQQRITDGPRSHMYRVHEMNEEDFANLLKESQELLDISSGPVFVADLFQTSSSGQLLSLVAHHLVTDVVSWRIILRDLEDLLSSDVCKLQTSLPFQRWSSLQLVQASHDHHPAMNLLEDVPTADFCYWGMSERPNVSGDAAEDGFELDAESSLALLGTCHEAMQTEPVDVFLATVLQSFHKVFPDRPSVPAIYNEGHGREPWEDSKLDVSRTVGWFTTMCPIFLPTNIDEELELINTVRWVKDLRHRIPDKGRPYFARRFLTEDGKQRFSNHWPMEVTFNYLGKLQQLEREDALFQPVGVSNNTGFDIGHDVPRFALFEISASVTNGVVRMSFSYNKNMKRQAKIRRWIMECQRSLQDAIKRLLRTKPDQSLCDFPRLPLTYNGISRLVERLPLLGVRSLAEIEDVYPSSPIQQGMLLAQLKNSELYTYCSIFEARTNDGQEVDARHLAEAWQAVVDQHSVLRTIFIESVCQEGFNDQVVLKDKTARVAWLECSHPEAEKVFSKQSLINFRDAQPPHRLSLCKTDRGLFCKLEISHTICDGTSIPILLRDLSASYASIVSSAGEAGTNLNHERRRATTKPQYGEYISYIQGKSLDDDINYWKAYLSGIEPCHITPLNDGIKLPKELRSRVVSFKNTLGLKTFCSQNGVTLSNVLQLVWALVLRIYTGTEEVCFGYLSSGRDTPIPGIQDEAIGAFINMLTCRLNLGSSILLGKAIQTVQMDFINGMSHQGASLATIQHELQLSSTSLFNTAFTFQKRTTNQQVSKSSLYFDIIESHDPSEYDITVNVEAFESAVEIHFGYWTTTLSERQAENMAHTFEHVVDVIISHGSADRRLSDLDLFSDHSRQQIMKWNASLPVSVEKCVHDMMRDQVSTQPPSTHAICAWDGNFTFTELDALSTQLALHLIELGVGSNAYVPLCFEKSAWNVVAMIAVLKAGAAFVPLDFTHPEARLKTFIDDVQGKLVLCSAQNLGKISNVAKCTLVVDRQLINTLEYNPSTTRYPVVSPDDPAYIIFTSGTTGRPKGTIIEHAAFCTSAVEHAKAMRMRSESRVFQFASHTFDASVMEILTPLVVGATICIPSEQERLNDIPGAIRRMGATWTLLTPSVASTLSPKSVPCLKTLVTGGEKMSSDHIAKWKGQCSLINAYGPTETSVIASTSTKVDEHGHELNSDPSNIGCGVGARVWIVDPGNYNLLVSVGGIGELVVEGRTVARGYLNNPEKTSEAFISDPSWLEHIEPRQRIYRTGDLVRYNSDGTLSFVNRKDTQIKLNGQRIELGEIEQNVKIILPDDVQSAVELVSPSNRASTKALAVFFTMNSGDLNSEGSIDEIRLPMAEAVWKVAKNLDSSLAAVLPKYMCPSFYIPVTKMPWTSSGKMDRTRLKAIVASLPREMAAPYRLQSSESKTSKAPTTAAEKSLQALWESVLNIAPPGSIGTDDSFFRLGGDSVTAMRLVGAARSQGLSLAVIDIFRNPRLCDMAEVCGTLVVEEEQQILAFSLLPSDHPVDNIVDEVACQCNVDKDAVLDVYPCSLLQEGLLTLSIKQPGAYVAKNVFKLPADIDIERFRMVWSQTVEGVDILRTRVVHMKSGDFLQALLEHQPIQWHSASSLEDVDLNESSIPSSNGGPLTQYTIVSDDRTGDCYFVWHVHHALYDGWSLPMVLKRVETAYLDSSSRFSKNYYSLFIKYLLQVDEEASDEFWKTRLLEASPLQFPQDQHVASDQACNNHMLTHTTPISRNTASMGITVPTIIRAAWSLVVAAYSGSDDVVFGEIFAGRDIAVPGIADIIGPTITTVPTRIKVNRGTSIVEFLQGIQKMATDIIPYQHAGLQHIKRINHDTELACDFRNLLVIQTAEEEIEKGLWDVQGTSVASNFFTYPLVLECKGGSDKIEILVHYSDAAMPKWQVERIIHQLDFVLQQLSNIPKLGTSAKLSAVEIISPEDQTAIKSWNSYLPNVVDTCIHEEFEEMALSQPDAQAVCAWDGSLTYGELRDHSARLAHHLITLGIGPEVFVPICMDKSLWAVVTIFGILMAGGAYVPLDPTAPTVRHQEMMKDVNAKHVVCSPNHAHLFAVSDVRLVSVDGTMRSSLASASSPAVDSSRARSHNAAYSIFTSGSTGRPKGTVVEHKAISTSSAAMKKVLLMKPTSRVFQFASFTFDVSVLEILTALSCGACVCMPSEDMRTRNVGEAINTLEATWAFLTPSVANIIEPISVPSLDVLVCGGEAMSIENVIKWAPSVTLVNGYGPTEASVIAVGNPLVSEARDPSNIGRALPNGHAWVVDPVDHNNLSPVGCVGELLLDGPLLAREYINNPVKTAEAFIERPPWAATFTPPFSASVNRMYKTGDLVQYNEDGSLNFIGRKDSQVKLNGQRLELGEIEHALDKDTGIQHALVALPKAGPFRKRLVAVISLTTLAGTVIPNGSCELIREGPQGAAARVQVVGIRNRLSENLPAYMIPSYWLAVESIPLLPSGKLDRRKVESWLHNIDDRTYERILEAEEDCNSVPATETTLLLQKIFSRVLNLPLQKTKLGQAFLSLGGDSISAMQVMALCRKEKLNFSLSDILRSKSIHQLASIARYEDEVQHQDEVLDQLFDLSPIQQLYFDSQLSNTFDRAARFNQSFSLEITKHLDPQKIRNALQRIVGHHSMLRSRFVKSPAGAWQQFVSRDSQASCHFRVHDVADSDHVVRLVGQAQSSLDIVEGPVFTVQLYNLPEMRQMLFLTAHHLVIDMVSWRIILQDLEELLTTGSILSDKPLSFQVWCSMQLDHALKSHTNPNTGVLPFQVPVIDIKYWGIEKEVNTYGQVVSETFTMSTAISDLILDQSNRTLRTEPVELFMAAISHSFARVFVDRKPPAIFNEGHGREPWDSSIDISRTVGWFTTIFPVWVEVDTDEDDLTDTVRRMKDARRSVPGNGREYFAHQFLPIAGKSHNKDRSGPMEIIFNYLGKMQQLEHEDSLLEQWEYPEDEETSKTIADVGPSANRLALFEISAAVVRDKIQFSFLYNRNFRHQQSIRRWVTECQETLQEIADRLAHAAGPASFTLSDFPLLPISYDGLQKIVTRSLPQVGIMQDEVEDMYPCAPLQEGLLISQLKNPSLYHFHAVFEVYPAQDGIPVDGDRLAKAWQKVVDRHAALRSVFADSVYKGDIFNQIVVKNVDSGVMVVRCDDEAAALDTLSKISILDANYTKQPRLPHQATICQTSTGKVYFKAEVNHAVIDGSSANIMLKDLAAAYHGRLPEGLGPLYSDYVAYIKSLPAGASIKFWKAYLNGSKACNFPVLNKDFVGTRALGSVAMDFDRFPELQEMCRKMNLTLANVMQAAWAFCLRHYTASEDICFGYLTSGRDVPVKGVQSTIGAFINMLVCRVKFQPQSTLKEVFNQVQNDYLQSLEHQHCSLAQVQHDLMGGKALFNTAVSIQSDGPSDGHEASSISFDPVAAHDPSEYAATLNIRTLRGDEGVVIRYWTDVMTPEQAEELRDMLARVMATFINKPHQLVEELDLSRKSEAPDIIETPKEILPGQPQLIASETQLRAIVSECVREIIEQMFKTGALVKHDQQNIGNTISNTVNNTMHIATQQAIQPMIDYSQLTMAPPRPQFNRTRSTSTIESITQLGGIEQKLLSVWSELLEISKDTIKKDDSFFSLGGDSIIAMQMVGMARDEDLALTVANVFRHPTFADMAAVIRMAEESQTPQGISDPKEYFEAREARSQAIQNALYQRYSLIETADVDTFLQDNICPKVRAFRGGIMDVFPITDFQALAVTGTLMESKWMLNYFYLEGEGALDLKRLKRSISRVVDSFEILRTVFVPHGNRFFQAVMRKVQPSFSVHEANDLAEFTLELQQKDRKVGPQLGESYLQFTVAKQTGSRRHRIIMRMSHAQYDGVCFPAILAAIQAGYNSQSIPATPAFSTYVRDAARNTTDDHYLYWKDLLKGSSMTEVVRRSGPNYSRGMDAPTTLKRVVRISSLASKNITSATIIKAAWSVTLAKWAAGSDVVFGNVISGRNAAVVGVESIVGPCVNLIPVRVTFQAGWTVMDLLRSIQDQQVAAMPYESLGFREIIKNCSPWPDWTNFSTVCQHQNIQRQTEVHLGDIRYTLGAVGSQEDFADLTIFSTPQNDDEIEISLIFTKNSGVTHTFAESMFEVLCETSVTFSTNTGAMLPVPNELSALPRQTLKQAAKPSNLRLATDLQDLTREDLIHYSEILNRVWSRILSDQNTPCPVLDLETSFYEMGGDIIGLAQVASLLEQEGMKLRVEDLVDHPVMVEQLALLVAFKKAQKEQEMEDIAAIAPVVQVEESPKKGIKKLLGKSVGLARKMRVGRSKGEAERSAE
ncbi:nonribosomal peptide synthase [Cadophora sp. MPI-SDFR-AT-0126]|nr:nonribosomal peptide synthase [Leotiomycetes sp. MPI-SDFR-AT-0126]